MRNAPGVILNVQRQPGANVMQTVDRVKALLPRLQPSLPASVDVKLIADRTTTIRASVADTEFELVLAVALGMMVIFLFLRSASATVIRGRRAAGGRAAGPRKGAKRCGALSRPRPLR